jgi:uncharacterized membrane protein YfcA
MLWVNTSIHRAVGTASALGIMVAIPAVVGYMLIGQNIDGLPAYAFGYVYGPAFLVIVFSTVFAAPFGAAAAHKLPVKALRTVFAYFILIVAIKMGFDLL